MTATAAFRGERPVANAFGASCGQMYSEDDLVFSDRGKICGSCEVDDLSAPRARAQLELIAVLVEVAESIEAKPSQVALAWLLAKPAVTSVIFGARTVEQLEINLGAAELELPEEAMAKLDEASAFELGYPYEFMKGVQNAW